LFLAAQPQRRYAAHSLSCKITPETPIVQGDRERLVQGVANILNNATKYTPEGGHLLLQTEVYDGYVHIQIVDDGIGMAPELVTRHSIYSHRPNALQIALQGD
jgi:signal transduction histidine kinase